MPAYPRSEWNGIIDQVNTLAEDCELDVTPIPQVEANHVWAKSDIRAVQDRLKEICPDNEFGPIPDLWKQSTIDEILAAIENGCCGDCWAVFLELAIGYELNDGTFTYIVDGVDLENHVTYYTKASNEADALAKAQQGIAAFYAKFYSINVVSQTGTLESAEAIQENSTFACDNPGIFVVV